MKGVKTLLAIIEDIIPTAKPSERLFLADLIIEEQKAAYKEASEKALDQIRDNNKQYADDLDSPDYSAIKEDFDNREDEDYDRASSNRGELI